MSRYKAIQILRYVVDLVMDDDARVPIELLSAII
jgi:hypothetical protein